MNKQEAFEQWSLLEMLIAGIETQRDLARNRVTSDAIQLGRCRRREKSYYSMRMDQDTGEMIGLDKAAVLLKRKKREIERILDND